MLLRKVAAVDPSPKFFTYAYVFHYMVTSSTTISSDKHCQEFSTISVRLLQCKASVNKASSALFVQHASEKVSPLFVHLKLTTYFRDPTDSIKQ